MFTIIDNKLANRIEVRYGYPQHAVVYSSDYAGSPESSRDAIASAQMFANTAARIWKKDEPVEVLEVVHIQNQ
jgi:hypothetical protein